MRTLTWLLIFFFPVVAQARVLTIDEAKNLARTNNERTATAMAQSDQMRAESAMAVGSLLPRLSARFTDTLQDSSANTGGSDVNSTFTRFSRPEMAFRVNQTLFQGFKEFYVAGSRGLTRRWSEVNENLAITSLDLDVSVAFFTIEILEKEIAATSRLAAVMRAQTSFLSEEQSKGKVRSSELSTGRADLLLLEADLAEAKGDLDIAYNALSNLTGAKLPFTIRARKSLGKLASLDSYLSRLNKSPEITLAQTEAALSKKEAGANRGNLLPRVDVQANAYGHRTGYQNNIKWDALFTVDVPLFDFVAISDYKRSKTLSKQAALKSDATLRDVEKRIRNSYAQGKAAQSGLSKLLQARSQTESSYQQERADYIRGIVDLDTVLNSRERLITSIRRSYQTELKLKEALATLEFLTGGTP